MIYSDLSKYVVKGKIKSEYSQKAWKTMSYETVDFKGMALVANDYSTPCRLKVKLPIKGLYRVFIGFFDIRYLNNAVELSYDNEGKTVINSIFHADETWMPYEFIQEQYYTTIDFNDTIITIGKPTLKNNAYTSIAYIRVEETAETEPQEKRICYHFDNDYYGETSFESDFDFTGRLAMLKNCNADRLILESSFDHIISNTDKKYKNFLHNESRYQRMFKALRRSEKIQIEHYKRAKKMGIEMFAGMRMSCGDFSNNIAVTLFNVYKNYIDANLDKCITTRDGRTIRSLSYAYPEVRDKMIKEAKQVCKNADGITLFFHRGVYVGFCKPVCDKVKETYGVDARRLPFGDKRLTEVKCSFITEFMRELRSALPKEKRIEVITLYGVSDSYENGFDIATWAREGYVDIVSQGLMTIYETQENILDEDGLINLEKYKIELGKRKILHRHFSGDDAHIVNGAKEYLDLLKGTNVIFYGALPWEHDEPIRYLSTADKLYDLGVEKLLCWNANHICKETCNLMAIKDSAHKSKVKEFLNTKEYLKFIRVLSEDGHDISYYDTNWRG